MSKQAGEVARRAAEIIKERGWHQGNFSGPNGEVCVRGSFNVAIGYCASDAEREFTEWMSKVVDLPLSPLALLDLEYDLAAWNDDPERTKEEVLAYLNKFAEEQDPQPVLP